MNEIFPAAEASSEQVLLRFRRLLGAVRRHFQALEKQTGIGTVQLWALQIVEARPGIGVSELARRLEVHQSTASNLVKLLMARGLLLGERSGGDRRMLSLTLAPAARELLARVPQAFAGALPAALAQLEPASLQRLDADLQRILAALPSD